MQPNTGKLTEQMPSGCEKRRYNQTNNAVIMTAVQEKIISTEAIGRASSSDAKIA